MYAMCSSKNFCPGVVATLILLVPPCGGTRINPTRAALPSRAFECLLERALGEHAREMLAVVRGGEEIPAHRRSTGRCRARGGCRGVAALLLGEGLLGASQTGRALGRAGECDPARGDGAVGPERHRRDDTAERPERAR